MRRVEIRKSGWPSGSLAVWLSDSMDVRKRDRAHDDACQGNEIKDADGCHNPWISCINRGYNTHPRVVCTLLCTCVYPAPLFVALDCRGKADKSDKVALAFRGEANTVVSTYSTYTT